MEENRPALSTFFIYFFVTENLIYKLNMKDKDWRCSSDIEQ
jgi:hypothetical protein